METLTTAKRKLRPFDAAKIDDFAMYNKLPYFRDIDICPPENITLVSGNVIKYFQYTMKDSLALSHIDRLALAKIAEHQERMANLPPSIPQRSKEDATNSKLPSSDTPDDFSGVHSIDQVSEDVKSSDLHYLDELDE